MTGREVADLAVQRVRAWFGRAVAVVRRRDSSAQAWPIGSVALLDERGLQVVSAPAGIEVLVGPTTGGADEVDEYSHQIITTIDRIVVFIVTRPTITSAVVLRSASGLCLIHTPLELALTPGDQVAINPHPVISGWEIV